MRALMESVDEVQKAVRKGVQMRKAPDMEEPSFLSVGRIIFSSTRRPSRIRCVGVLAEKCKVYVDKAVWAALLSCRRCLISFFLSLTYDFKTACSFSLTAALVSNPNSSSASPSPPVSKA